MEAITDMPQSERDSKQGVLTSDQLRSARKFFLGNCASLAVEPENLDYIIDEKSRVVLGKEETLLLNAFSNGSVRLNSSENFHIANYCLYALLKNERTRTLLERYLHLGRVPDLPSGDTEVGGCIRAGG